jgi:hypothetical protein
MRRMMPVKKLTKLLSVDSGLWSIDSTRTAGDIASSMKNIQDVYPDLYQAVIDGESPPVHLCKGKDVYDVYEVDVPSELRNRVFYGNGHHRLACAIKAGLKWLEVTDDVTESGEDWAYG